MEKNLSLKVCGNVELFKANKSQRSAIVSRYCLVKQRTVCIINAWGYTEILQEKCVASAIPR